MRKVYNFRNMKELAERINSSKKAISIVTATEDLGKSLKTNGLINGGTTVLGAGSLVKKFIPEWEDTIKDIKNYVRIRDVVEDYIFDNNSMNAETKEYLRRNTAEMWNAIVLLTEADAYPDDIPDKPKYLKYFKQIWKEIEIKNPQIVSFRSKMKFCLFDNENLELFLKSEKIVIDNTIYFVGFYFITPIQERIIDYLEKNDINIIFLNCKDDEYAYMNEIWDITYPDSSYLKTNTYGSNAIKNHYGEALKNPSMDITCSVIKHTNVFEFASMVKEAFDQGDLIYSPNSKMSEKYLREFYPEHFKEKHLLSYPVGQYIYYLHMMWDSFDNKLIFDFEYVYQCFASGWLMIEEYNGKNYLHDMSLLKNYFAKCDDLEKWIKNINTLKKAKDVTDIFEDENTREDRWHRLLGQPLNKIGVYTIPLERIVAIEKLFYKLVDDAKQLFSKSGKVDLYDHFSNIKRIIVDKITLDKDKILTEESQIINKLIEKLSDTSVKDITCPLNGIKDAIILLINGQENNSSSFTERIKSNNHMVAPLEMIESATINSNVKRVHLVLADEFSLPGSPTELPWPLDISLVDSMIKQVSPKRRKYMEALKSIVVNSPVSNRYLFFTFMGLENVELSIEWISKKENREIEVSPFVSLFNFINPSDEKTKNEVGLSGRKILHFNLEPQQPTSVPDDVLLDYVLCKERYIYSYILNEYPFFSTDFHYAFLLTKIITAFSEVTKEEPKLISQEMNELFPFFRSVELKQSLDYVSSKLKGKIPPIIYDNVEYPGARLQIHYLDNEIIDYCEKIQSSNFDDTKSMVPSPKKKCIFCPYSNICMVRFSKEDDAHES